MANREIFCEPFVPLHTHIDCESVKVYVDAIKEIELIFVKRASCWVTTFSYDFLPIFSITDQTSVRI